MREATMKREEWDDLVADVEWTFSYVDEEAVFPEWMCGTGKVPRDAWKAWEESYRTTYGEYVATQSEKEAAAYSVKAALQRSNVADSLDEGWKSCAKLHYGATALAEYMAAIAELRMARFGLAPRWRNMAMFGALDEIRHTQLALSFAHELVSKDVHGSGKPLHLLPCQEAQRKCVFRRLRRPECSIASGIYL